MSKSDESYATFKNALRREKLIIPRTKMHRLIREEAQDFMTNWHFTQDAELALHVATEQFIDDWMKDKLPKCWIRDEILDLPTYMDSSGTKYDSEKTRKVIDLKKFTFNTVQKKGCWVLTTDDEEEEVHDKEWLPRITKRSR